MKKAMLMTGLFFMFFGSADAIIRENTVEEYAPRTAITAEEQIKVNELLKSFYQEKKLYLRKMGKFLSSEKCDCLPIELKLEHQKIMERLERTRQAEEKGRTLTVKEIYQLTEKMINFCQELDKFIKDY